MKSWTSIVLTLLLAVIALSAAPPPAKEGAPYDRESAMKDFKRPDTIPFPDDNRYTRARAELGFAPQVGLSDGIQKTLAWYREYGWL